MIFTNCEFVAKYLTEGEVSDLNSVYRRISELRQTEMSFGEPPFGYNVSDKIRAHGQAHLWRCLDLCYDAEILRRNGSGLSSMILTRAVIETIASYWHFSEQLSEKMSPLSNRDDLDRIQDFIRSKAFSTRREPLRKLAKDDGVNLDITNILTKVDKLEKQQKGVRQHYDYLCEFAHPNQFGVFGWFAEPSQIERKTRFSAGKVEHEPEILRCVAYAVTLLEILETALINVEKSLPELTALGNLACKNEND